MYFDYHLHSEYSDDSTYPMEQVVLDAIEMGLEEICFTDHVDYGIKIDWDSGIEPKYVYGKPLYNVDYPKYFKELNYLQEKYQDKIVIKKGLEFGIQTHTIPIYEKLFSSYEMDFVLLSIHQLGDKEFWTHEFQQGKTLDECYKAYYKEMYDVISNFDKYSVLAHMDLIRRYTEPQDFFEHSKEDITRILMKVIQEGKGIEVNTSSFRYGIDGLTPSIEILKLYHELGGTIITIGSDSHKPKHLGEQIRETMAVLKEIGYKYICTFEKMKPIYHNL